MQTTLYQDEAAPLQEIRAGGTHSSSSRMEWMVLLLALFLIEVAALGQAAMKFFWYDELVTLRIAGLPSLSAIFSFYKSGKDTTTFLPAMIVHAAALIPGRAEIITRLPFELAYLLTCLCVYRFIRNRYSAGFALSGMLTFALGYSFYYATEIRAYAFLMLGSAIACLTWQSLNSHKESRAFPAIALWIGLSIAILFHFFAVFLFIPFAAAQFVHDRVDNRTAGRTRWSAWIPLLLFPLSILPMLPGVLAARHIYGKTFWSPPTLRSLMEVYNDFGDTPAKMLPVLLILLALYLWQARSRRIEDAPQPAGQGFSLAEWTLLFTLAIFPLICLFGALPLGVYRVQYVMPFFVGIVMLIAGLLAEFTRRSPRHGWILAAVLLLFFCGQQKIRMVQGFRCLLGKPASVTLPTEYNAKWYEAIASSPLPIVADGADTFLVLEHYGPPELRNRLTLLTSNQRARLRPTAMTNELNMETFGRALGFNVQDYDTFTAQHHDFLIVADTAQFEYTWLTWSLLQQSRDTHNVQVSFFPGPDQLDHSDQTYLVHLGQLSGAPGQR